MKNKIKLVFIGAGKESAAKEVNKLPYKNVESLIGLSEIEAVNLLKNGEADYIIGCCWTGSGILAIPTAILGYQKCFIVKELNPKEIENAVMDGKVVFGSAFASDSLNKFLQIALPAMLKKHGLA